VSLLKYEGGDVAASLVIFETDFGLLVEGLAAMATSLRSEGVQSALEFETSASGISKAVRAGLESIAAVTEAAGLGEGASSVLAIFTESVLTNMGRAVEFIASSLQRIDTLFSQSLQTLPSQAYALGTAIGAELERGFQMKVSNLRAQVGADSGDSGGGTNITNHFDIEAIYPQYQSEATLEQYVRALRLVG